MERLRPQIARAHKVHLRTILELERRGEFDDALREARVFWDDTTQPPVTEKLDARSTAETYLRCGALIGFLGHIRQIPTAQERSKNLLTCARSSFLEIIDSEKLAECENYLALAYWRTGETNEARSWVDEALSHDLPSTCDTRLYSFVIRDLVLLSQKRYSEICSHFTEFIDLFEENGDDFLTGNFCNNFGVAARHLGKGVSALSALEKARDLFVSSGNKIQIALAENNLAQLHKSAKRFPSAHAAIDRATKLFRQIKDRTREGFSLDTKALIHLEEGKYDAALRTVEKAIAILGTGENLAYLTETIATKARIQLFSADFATATLTLVEAVDLARSQIGEEAATNLIREFERSLAEQSARSKRPETAAAGLATGDLKLVLPSTLAHYKDFQGVWITNSDLEPYGLRPGHLAVIVPEAVRRGDLVAIAELESDAVSCGFYDSDFGIVCIEAGDAEPQLFNEKEVRILGRIVGVSSSDARPDGTIEVKALSL